MRPRYFDTTRTPDHSLAAIKGRNGVYESLTGRIMGIATPCEHCDGERSPKVRLDALRGFVCPHCDSAIDEMLDEEDPCADHWHCDPQAASHVCDRPDRSIACPACGMTPTAPR